MEKCEICGKDLPPFELQMGYAVCNNCATKKELLKRLIETCDEFKRIINYEGILEQREREKDNADQR